MTLTPASPDSPSQGFDSGNGRPGLTAHESGQQAAHWPTTGPDGFIHFSVLREHYFLSTFLHRAYAVLKPPFQLAPPCVEGPGVAHAPAYTGGAVFQQAASIALPNGS